MSHLRSAFDPPASQSLRHLVEHWAQRTPEGIAITAPGRAPLTYRRLLARIDAVAEALVARGVGPHDRVAIALPNGPETAVAFLGVASSAACAPLNPDTGNQDLSLGCVQPTPEAPGMPVPTPLADREVAYFSSVGDIKITYISNCILTSLLDACRSPSTIFFEQPQDLLAAIISVNSGQNTDPSKPPAGIRLELYQDGQLIEVGNNPSTKPMVTTTF